MSPANIFDNLPSLQALGKNPGTQDELERFLSTEWELGVQEWLGLVVQAETYISSSLSDGNGLPVNPRYVFLCLPNVLSHDEYCSHLGGC